MAYRLLCVVCRYKLRCEVMRYGESLGVLVFFDDEETSLNRGERVWRCPRCRRRLDLLSFRS